MTDHLWTIACCVLGWYAHLWHASREMSAARGERVWPHRFVLLRPMRCVLSLFGAVAGYLLLLEIGWLTLFGAFAAGFVSEYMLDKVREVAGDRLGIRRDQVAPPTSLSDTTILRDNKMARGDEP